MGAGSRTIGRRTSTPGSKGTSSPTQSTAASKVGKLNAMHHGLIAKQTNRGVEPDQWRASRYSRERMGAREQDQGANEMQPEKEKKSDLNFNPQRTDKLSH